MGAVRLISLSAVTYFMISSNAHFQDISDSWTSIELPVVGLSSLGFYFLMKSYSQIGQSIRLPWVTPEQLEKNILPGLLYGTILGSGLILGFIFGKLYTYLGVYLPLEEAPLGLLNISIRSISLVSMVFVEEFIFRQRTLEFFRSRKISNWIGIILTSLFFILTKLVQFDLSWLQLFTLFLISISLGIRAVSESNFVRGAGFFAGLLLVFHPLLSLPILGSEIQGIIMVKYIPSVEVWGDWARYLSGGAGGPLASVALQALLFLQILRGSIKHRKILWSPRAN